MDTKPAKPEYIDFDWSEYNPVRLLAYLADPRSQTRHDARAELKVAELARDFYDVSSEGLCIPPRPTYRAPPMDTTGGLVGPGSNIAPDFVEYITQASRVAQLGGRILPGLRENVKFSAPTGVTVSLEAEDDAATSSEVTVADCDLTLDLTIMCNVPITRRLLLQSVPAADQFVADAVATEIAAQIDGEMAKQAVADGAVAATVAAGEDLLVAEGTSITGMVLGPTVWKTHRDATDNSVIRAYAPGVHQVFGYRAFPHAKLPASHFAIGDFRCVVAGLYGPLIVDRLTTVPAAAQGSTFMHFEQSLGVGTMDGARAFAKNSL